MLKTTMGMLGEYEYDTVYNESDVPPLTWAVYVAFLVINCVIIVNLLVSNIFYLQVTSNKTTKIFLFKFENREKNI